MPGVFALVIGTAASAVRRVLSTKDLRWLDVRTETVTITDRKCFNEEAAFAMKAAFSPFRLTRPGRSGLQTLTSISKKSAEECLIKPTIPQR
ncbi:hypothetical protein EMEDMD4_150083 [Sinorhizobium medicae]|uniref:Uncharacterized protein n=1 Tax=Sinorhizobium medicae TaxID=110321 RepID=A0A508WSJ1_9HYPH|nr:hypothetical protein EMEDMD4_150083 [Sinorhizobium medicae]